METVFAAFMASAERAPENAFLCAPPAPGRAYDPAGVEYTYGETRARVLALQALYRAGGYGPGTRVALQLGNRPDFFFHFLALNGLGAAIVPVNPDYRDDELLYLLTHSEADLVVSVPEDLARLRRVAVRREAPLAVIDSAAFPTSLPEPPRPPPDRVVRGAAALCGLLYTSGTTGRPKGCILTNEYYLTAGGWYRDLGGMIAIRPGEERILNPLPLFHMNCQAVTAVCVMLTQNCLVLPERFSPSRWWADVVASDATIVHYLGVVPPLLLNQPTSELERCHRLRFGLGAGVEPELHARFEERFGFPLIEVWGMTETGRIFADSYDPRQIATRAFGRPFGGFEAKVVNEDGWELPHGQEGELLVRAAGPNPRRGFFSGYLKNEAATEEAWAGGWFHSGDVVRQAADGMLYFVDRKKNIIRRAGENIAAAEIEAVLQAHEAVAQVAVLAAPDEIREEEVMACIVAMPGHEADAALAGELFAWCNERLAYYKAPGWILFVAALPTTGTQKVQKTQIFAAGEDPRTRAGAIDLRERKKRPR